MCEGKSSDTALNVTDIAGKVICFNKCHGFWFHKGSSGFLNINMNMKNNSFEWKKQTNQPNKKPQNTTNKNLPPKQEYLQSQQMKWMDLNLSRFGYLAFCLLNSLRIRGGLIISIHYSITHSISILPRKEWVASSLSVWTLLGVQFMLLSFRVLATSKILFKV